MAQDVRDSQQKNATPAPSSSSNFSSEEVDAVLRKVERDTQKESVRNSQTISSAINEQQTAIVQKNASFEQQFSTLQKNKAQLDMRLKGISEDANPVVGGTRAFGKSSQSRVFNEPSAEAYPEDVSGTDTPIAPSPKQQPFVPVRGLDLSGLAKRMEEDQLTPPQTISPQPPAIPRPVSDARKNIEPIPEVQQPAYQEPLVQSKLIKKKQEVPKELGEAVGQATTEWWWAGFGISAAVFFSGFDFMLGALIMDGYWIAHARRPDFFPFRKWQKVITVFANIVPLLYAVLFIAMFFTIACNMTQYRVIIAGAELVSGSKTGICTNFDLSKMGSVPATGVVSTGGAITGGGHVGNGTCSSTDSGPAGVSALSQTCFGQNAPAASAIAVAESGNDATKASKVDICTGDGSVASWGLFQINITNHKIGGLDCPSVFTHQYTGSHKDCSVIPGMESLYQQCVAAAQDPNLNIQAACAISSNGTNWNAWGANSVCKIN